MASNIETTTNAIYSIQLNDSELRSVDSNESESSIITYNWKHIETSNLLSNSDIYISVAKAYAKYDDEFIKRKAKDIIIVRKLKKDDLVIGTNEREIIKIGFIKKVMKLGESEISIIIDWVSHFENYNSDIIRTNVEIQKLSNEEIIILRKSNTGFNSSFRLLPSYLKEEQNALGMKNATLANDDDDEIDDYTPKEDVGGSISLFYGTCRKLTKNNQMKFGNEAGELQFGTCEVQVPAGHIQGELERPKRFFVWNFPENQNVHFSIKNITEKSYNEFLNDFNAELNENKKKNALIFLHGYNTSFEDAAYRTAQIAWDIPFNGMAGFFSWPSDGKILPYLKDESYARSSSKAFSDFIKVILENEKLEKLHIIAHSMGNHLLTLSLNQLSREESLREMIKKIHQIILAAPDIDQVEFRSVIMPEFNKIGDRRTLYVSDRDNALEVSSWLRSNLPRMGQAGDDIFLSAGIDTIETSNIKTKDHHSYLFESKLLLSDLYYLLEYGLAPVERRLRAIVKNNLKYWLLPK